MTIMEILDAPILFTEDIDPNWPPIEEEEKEDTDEE